jgi:nicotinate-nucleotide pyrophosphorylase (carboxylating)
MLSNELRGSIVLALQEDLGPGDVTSRVTVAEDSQAEASLVAHEAGIVAGLAVAEAVFRELDPGAEFTALVPEGGSLAAEQSLATISGQARAILSAERTALNYLGRMCGIATMTHAFVEAVAGTPARIVDTRKTAPGLRAFDKLAVRCGGGHNHRFGLYDMILIKDNHIDLAGSLAEAVRRAQAAGSGLEIEVEARTLEDVRAALASGARRILLDNMTPESIRRPWRSSAAGSARASGNVRWTTSVASPRPASMTFPSAPDPR